MDTSTGSVEGSLVFQFIWSIWRNQQEQQNSWYNQNGFLHSPSPKAFKKTKQQWNKWESPGMSEQLAKRWKAEEAGYG